MPSSTKRFAAKLLSHVARRRPDDFTGLGVVFYENLETLPFIGLHVLSEHQIALPVTDLEEIAMQLAAASSASSAWHDGFHFVDGHTRTLTHLAQFLSPPIPVERADAPLAAGARHMTAMLASKVKGILGVGLLAQDGEVTLFENGLQTLRETTR